MAVSVMVLHKLSLEKKTGTLQTNMPCYQPASQTASQPAKQLASQLASQPNTKPNLDKRSRQPGPVPLQPSQAQVTQAARPDQPRAARRQPSLWPPPPEFNRPSFGHHFWAPFKTPPHKSGRLRVKKKWLRRKKIG